MRETFGYSLGSTVVLLGAFVIGGVLHQAFVERTVSPTSPFAVLGLLVGGALVAVGWRVERSFAEQIEEDDDEDESEFDESEAPFDESDLEKYERSDS